MIDYIRAKKYTDSVLESSFIAKIYGVSWDKGSSPALTRIRDSVGMTAAAGVDGEIVTNDFDNAQIYREIGEVVDTVGNVFVRIPKFYIRKTDTAVSKTWEISKHQYPGFYLPWCFWDFANNKELPYIDVGKYKATLGTGNKLESKPDSFPLINTNIVNMRTYAQNNNVDGLLGYQQLDIHAVDVLRTLFFVEFATLDAQSVMRGWSAGQYSSSHTATVAETATNRIIVANATAALYAVGQPISIGTTQGGNQVFYGRTITSVDVYDADNKAISFDGAPVDIAVGNMLYNTGWKNGFSSGIAASSGSIGSNSTGKFPCAYRGIESPFGDVFQFVDGVNINDRQAWICKNAEQYASNVFASPYEQLPYINADADGYIKEMGFDARFPFAELPTSIGGNASTYYCDQYYQDVGQRIARFGGYWSHGSSAGISCWSLNFSSSTAFVFSVGRLLRKPL